MCESYKILQELYNADQVSTRIFKISHEGGIPMSPSESTKLNVVKSKRTNWLKINDGIMQH